MREGNWIPVRRAAVMVLAAAAVTAQAPLPASAAPKDPGSGIHAARVAAKPLPQSRKPLGAIRVPSDQALRTRAAGPVVVRLQLVKSARLKTVRLNGVDVTDRARTQGREVRLSLKPKGPLRFGANGLIARFVRDGRQSIASSRFTFVRRGTGLIRVGLGGPSAAGESGAGRSAGPLPVTVRMNPSATLTATLNGKNVTDRFATSADGRLRAQLGPSAGLRYGNNTVVVQAVTAKGRIQKRSLTVRVRDDGPLADAGPDRRTDTRHAVRLDGTRTKPSGGEITYRWRVADAPKNAAVRLRGARKARPTFAATTPGTYTLSNTARGAGTSTDKVMVSVSPSASVQPVSMTIGPQTDGTAGPGIAVGSTFYPGGNGPGMQLVVLERSTLAPQNTESYAPGQMNELNQDLVQAATQANASDYLFVLASLPGGSPVSDQADLNQLVLAMQWLGFRLPDPSDPDSAIDPAQPFAMVSIPNPVNTDEGTAGYLQAALDGVFTPDVNDNWTYNNADYAAFGTGGAQITIGEQSWPTPTTGTGFQVVVADPLSLQGSSDVFAMPGDVQEMAQVLQTAVSSSQIVAVRSFGVLPNLDQTTTQSAAAAFAQVSQALQALGGSPSVFMGLGPGDTYSLLGPTLAGSYPAEASTTIGGNGTVSGLLSRIPEGGQFFPIAADPTGNAVFASTLAEIAVQPAQAWPQSSTPGQLAALAYLSEKIDVGCDVTPCDVRTEYDNLNYSTQWTGLVSSLDRIADPCPATKNCRGFTSTDFTDVRKQLAKEFRLVDDTWSLVSSLQEPFTATEGSSTTAVQRAVDAVDLAVSPPANTTATTVLSFVTDVMWAVSLVDVEAFAVYATVAGVLAVGAAAGGDLADLPSGSPYQAVADAGPVFTNDIIDQLGNTMQGIGLLGQFVVQDWGRLSAVGSQVGGPWSINSTTQAELATGAVSGAVQNMYSALMPVAYTAHAFSPPPGTGQGVGQCQPAWWNPALPWEKAAGPASYLNLVAPPVTDVEPDQGLEWYALWEAGKSPTGLAGPTGGPPSGTLMYPMYEPYSSSQPQNAGLFAPWFWGRTYLSSASVAPKVLKCKYR